MDKKELPSMENFLNDEYVKFVTKKGRVTSAAEFAKWLGVPNTSLSQWMNGIREPVGNNVFKLANKLGPIVYDILGQPRRVPEGENAQQMFDVYQKLGEEAQLALNEMAENLLEDQQTGKPIKRLNEAQSVTTS